MKKLTMLFIIGLVLIAGITLIGCKDDGVTPTPPVEEPIPPTFEETITGKFWSVDKVEKYAVTTRSAVDNPYELDTCMYFGADGMITFWEDANDDGLLSPSEQVNGVIPWEIVNDTLVIGSQAFDITYFDAEGWAIETDVTGTTLGEWFGNEGEPYEGWIRIHYVPCLKGFDDGVVTASFAFVFDDMGDLNAQWTSYCRGRWHHLDVDFDFVDGFYYTFGENHIIIASYYDGPSTDIDTGIFIGSDEYGMEIFGSQSGFKPNHVYDMTMVIDSADVATFTFVSRIDGSGFTIVARMDHSVLGEIVIRGVNDVDVPVVNP